MASLGVEAIKAWAENGSKPENTPGLDFFNTGVNLVTDDAASGVPSISVAEAWTDVGVNLVKQYYSGQNFCPDKV